MAVEDYQRNLRAVNDGSDFPPELLVSWTFHIAFDSISTNLQSESNI